MSSTWTLLGHGFVQLESGRWVSKGDIIGHSLPSSGQAIQVHLRYIWQTFPPLKTFIDIPLPLTVYDCWSAANGSHMLLLPFKCLDYLNLNSVLIYFRDVYEWLVSRINNSDLCIVFPSVCYKSLMNSVDGFLDPFPVINDFCLIDSFFFSPSICLPSCHRLSLPSVGFFLTLCAHFPTFHPFILYRNSNGWFLMR